jgi:uncharacterized SAM-binding protein YcdF (DUF218 family)
MTAHDPTTRARSRRGGCAAGCLRGCLGCLGVLAVVTLLIFLVAPPLLEAYARWFIVTDPSERTDVAVALSGGDGERLHAAMALYKQHLAGALCLVGPDQPLLKVYTGEDSLTQAEAKRRIVVRRGIPADSVVVAVGAYSTWDEANLVREEARRHGWRSITIVTDPYHTRRARATFRRVLHDDGVRVIAYHLPPGRSQFRPEKWWKRELDTMAVLTESIKAVFYAHRYRVWPWG